MLIKAKYDLNRKPLWWRVGSFFLQAFAAVAVLGIVMFGWAWLKSSPNRFEFACYDANDVRTGRLYVDKAIGVAILDHYRVGRTYWKFRGETNTGLYFSGANHVTLQVEYNAKMLSGYITDGTTTVRQTDQRCREHDMSPSMAQQLEAMR